MLFTCVLATPLAMAAPAAAPAARLEPDDLAGPPLELAADVPQLGSAVPEVPDFALSPVGQGLRSPRELRLRGRRWLGAEVRVQGTVTWIYDCAAQLAARDRKLSRARLQRKIAADPSLCERPSLTLGDTSATSREDSILVTELPRPPTPLERKRLPKAELGAWPKVPRVKVGDRVELTGTWEHGSRGEGILRFTALTPLGAAPAVATAAAPPDPAEPALVLVTRPPPRKAVDAKVRAASLTSLAAGTRAFAQGQHQVAIAACEQATAAWPGNHLAFYVRGSAHMAKGEWSAARAAVERAALLRPDLAMYQLYHGVALYEEARAIEAAAEAARSGQDAALLRASISVPATSAALPLARDALRGAMALAPRLWRAHVYLARVYLDLDEPRRAAERLTEAIRAHPRYQFSYLSLIELYRRWGYLDQAAGVAKLGATTVAAADAPELWLQVGTLAEARGQEAEALDAYNRALALRADHVPALFSRGKLHHRRGDRARASADLQAVAQSRAPEAASLAAAAAALLASFAP